MAGSAEWDWRREAETEGRRSRRRAQRRTRGEKTCTEAKDGERVTDTGRKRNRVGGRKGKVDQPQTALPFIAPNIRTSQTPAHAVRPAGRARSQSIHVLSTRPRPPPARPGARPSTLHPGTSRPPGSPTGISAPMHQSSLCPMRTPPVATRILRIPRHVPVPPNSLPLVPPLIHQPKRNHERIIGNTHTKESEGIRSAASRRKNQTCHVLHNNILGCAPVQFP